MGMQLIFVVVSHAPFTPAKSSQRASAILLSNLYPCTQGPTWLHIHNRSNHLALTQNFSSHSHSLHWFQNVVGRQLGTHIDGRHAQEIFVGAWRQQQGN